MSFLRPAFTRPFLRHYAEMVVAMYAGMLVLGMPLDRALDAAGADTHAVALLNMAVVMTVPMVAWMRWRHRHGWRPCLDMAASMFLPTFAAMALLATGAGFGAAHARRARRHVPGDARRDAPPPRGVQTAAHGHGAHECDGVSAGGDRRRRRPGRPGDRLPPRPAGPAVHDPRSGRRAGGGVARALGLAAAVHARALRQPPRPGVPGRSRTATRVATTSSPTSPTTRATSSCRSS